MLDNIWKQETERGSKNQDVESRSRKRTQKARRRHKNWKRGQPESFTIVKRTRLLATGQRSWVELQDSALLRGTRVFRGGCADQWKPDLRSAPSGAYSILVLPSYRPPPQIARAHV